jgi:tetratricopeptide (TPR) repeat protein
MFSISALLFSADDSSEELEKKLAAASGKEKIEVLNQLSASYLNHSPEKSIDWGNKALQLARELRDPKGEAIALKNIGSGNRALSKYEKALEYFNHSLRIFETIKSDKDIGDCFYFIGVTYFYLSNYDKALEYFLKSLEINEKIGKRGRCLTF